MRYTFKRKLLAVGRDYAIEDEGGRACFVADGKVRIATTFVLKRADGTRVAKGKEQLLKLDRTFVVTRAGAAAATVRRTSTGDVPHRFEIEVEGAAPMQAEGSFLAGSIDVTRAGARVARLSFVPRQAVNETFHLDVSGGEDEVLVVAIATCLIAIDDHRGELASAT